MPAAVASIHASRRKFAVPLRFTSLQPRVSASFSMARTVFRSSRVLLIPDASARMASVLR